MIGEPMKCLAWLERINAGPIEPFSEGSGFPNEIHLQVSCCNPGAMMSPYSPSGISLAAPARDRSNRQGGTPALKESRISRRSRLMILPLCFGIAALAASVPAETPSDNASRIIAQGDHGFVVTEQDVEDLTRFIEKYMSFETTSEALRAYAVRTFLFAKEARRQGLHVPESFQPLAPVHVQVVLAEAYLDQVLNDYALDPVVIESYYKAHFEDYVTRPETLGSRNLIPEEALVPLESLKESIRKTLLALVRQNIAEQTFRRLVESYRVTGEFSHGS